MIDSLRKNKKGITLMICSAVFVSFGQMYWKLFHTHGLWALALGTLLYAFGALVMLYAYKFGKLSVLQPMLSLSYILALFLAVGFLGEPLTPLKVAGVAVIIGGVILIGGGDE